MEPLETVDILQYERPHRSQSVLTRTNRALQAHEMPPLTLNIYWFQNSGLS